ncbi:MAG: glutamine synthetase [Planctomycetes bacterium]|nr:glutamine synthetase [Planctomycetota bacterium]
MPTPSPDPRRISDVDPGPRSGWTTDDLVEYVGEEDIPLVSLMHVGGDGWLKTLDFAPRDEHQLRRILRGGDRADGSSLFPRGMHAGASDIVLRPRPETAFLDPFAATRTLVVRCGHDGPDGAPLPQSPDTIVRRADRRLAEHTGVELLALGEVEFFLGRRADETPVFGADERGYHATAPFVFGEALRREAMVCLRDLGIPLKYGHSEVGYVEPTEAGDLVWEQHEIELDLLPLPDAADAILLTHWVLRNLAHARGLQCSIDPLVAHKHAGNGLHFHFAVGAEERPEAGADDATPLTPSARALIGGLVEMGGALMVFGNRRADSFARLGQGLEAPTAISWGACDRSALIRLPVVPRSADGTALATATIEFRLPDGSAHPHLLLAGVAQAMCHGHDLPDLDALLDRTGSRADGADRDRLPTSFAEVAEALARFRPALEAGDVFPPAFIDALLTRLRSE